MKQVLQSVSGGPVRVEDVPRPTIDATQVLVQTVATTISAGTEKAVTALAQSSLLAKAKARPDLVRQVMKKARTDGVRKTVETVRGRLDSDIPLGYSGAGIVLEVGEAVAGIMPGQLVATGGQGNASHAEFQAVPGLLCAPVPHGVSAQDASFATIAAIALHGLRLAQVGPGSKVVVIGLGLIGQLAVRLAQASGCDVAGIDVAQMPIDKATEAGAFALRDEGASTTAAILQWSRGLGADAVLITAAGKSSDVMARVPELCRDRAEVVVVGDVGLNLSRTPFYEKELSIRFARSYGPGRYERTYEDYAVDYPAGFVRWTEGRNIQAVLDLLASGRLAVADLVTHTFQIEAATRAYQLIEERSEPYLGIQLSYLSVPSPSDVIRIAPARPTKGEPGVGLIGAGAFASGTLIPAFKEAGFTRFVSVASASGISAKRLAERAGFETAVAGAHAVINDPAVDVVVIATPHDTHADLAVKALEAGKHVFCEKPLAMTEDDLDRVETAWRASGKVLFVGFNRRYSPAIQIVQEALNPPVGALAITYRISAGPVPAKHWYHDRRQGGRLAGEVCHFIDLCCFLADSECVGITALPAATGNEEAQLVGSMAMTFAFESGTLATILYSDFEPGSDGKERIEVASDYVNVRVEDFQTTVINGRSTNTAGKGHAQQIREFRTNCANGSKLASHSMIRSSRIALRTLDKIFINLS